MHPSLGQRLAGARRARGMSVLDVAHHTRISAAHIRRLESDDIDGLPSPVYAKSFLKQLDRYLDAGLGQEIDAFDPDLPPTSPEVLIQVPSARPRAQALATQTGEPRPAIIGLLAGIILLITVPVVLIKWYQYLNPTIEIAAPAKPNTTPAKTEPPKPRATANLLASQHIPLDAPPELAAIDRLENDVELDELALPALAAVQPVPQINSRPPVESTTIAASSTTRYPSRPSGSRSTTTRATPATKPTERRSFFSRIFGSKKQR